MVRLQLERHTMLLVYCLLALQQCVDAIVVSICATDNTGATSNPTNFNLNSLGHCSDVVCVGYAFAIAQGESCWCSDYAPSASSTLNVGDCNEPCPGFPYEFCGSLNGDFSYVQLAASSGTDSPSSAPSTTVPAVVVPSTSLIRTTVIQTQTLLSTLVSNSVIFETTAIIETSVISISATSPTQTVTQVMSITPSSSRDTLSRTTLQVTTEQLTTVVSGSVKTSFVTVTPVAAPSEASSGAFYQESTGLSGGAIAGIVIGVIAGVLLLGLLLLCCLRRRRRDNQSGYVDGQMVAGGKVTRGSSVLSKAGLLRHGSSRRGPSTASTLAATSAIGSQPPRLDTNIPFMASIDPSTGTSPRLERRDSRPLFVDYRLNPNAVMLHQDTSRSSFQTLEDNHDYSRPLEVRNP